MDKIVEQYKIKQIEKAQYIKLISYHYNYIDTKYYKKCN